MNFLVKIGIGVDPITVDNEIEEAENWAIKAITSFFGIKKSLTYHCFLIIILANHAICIIGQLVPYILHIPTVEVLLI